MRTDFPDNKSKYIWVLRKIDINYTYKLYRVITINTNMKLQEGVKIMVVSALVVLKETTICVIPDANEEGFWVRTKGDTRNLSKKINLLLLLKPILCVIDMHKISWLSHWHELSIRCKTNWSNCSQITLQHCNWLRQISSIPNTASFILVPSGKNVAIRMPCGGKREVQMSMERHYCLHNVINIWSVIPETT